VNAVIALNAGFGIADSIYANREDLIGHEDDESNREEVIAFWLLIITTFIFTFEMIGKILVLGYHHYWKDYSNRFDAIVTLASLLSLIIARFSERLETAGTVTKFIVVIRILRVTRLLNRVPAFQQVISTFSTIVPKAMTLFIGLLVFTLVYATIGQQALGGVLNISQNTTYYHNLTVSDYGSYNMYNFNFNDCPQSMVSLFLILLSAQVSSYIQSGYAVALSTPIWLGAYFSIYFLFAHLIVLNVLVSFTLDAFLDAGKKERDLKRERKNMLALKNADKHLFTDSDDQNGNINNANSPSPQPLLSSRLRPTSPSFSESSSLGSILMPFLKDNTLSPSSKSQNKEKSNENLLALGESNDINSSNRGYGSTTFIPGKNDDHRGLYGRTASIDEAFCSHPEHRYVSRLAQHRKKQSEFTTSLSRAITPSLDYKRMSTSNNPDESEEDVFTFLSSTIRNS